MLNLKDFFESQTYNQGADKDSVVIAAKPIRVASFASMREMQRDLGHDETCTEMVWLAVFYTPSRQHSFVVDGWRIDGQLNTGKAFNYFEEAMQYFNQADGSEDR